jgi:hypothetical protein
MLRYVLKELAKMLREASTSKVVRWLPMKLQSDRGDLDTGEMMNKHVQLGSCPRE